MSFDLPTELERDLERYAQAEHITPAEAVVKFVQSGLKRSQSEQIDWERYQQLVPGVALFQSLAEGALEDMVESSNGIRSEKLIPRA